MLSSGGIFGTYFENEDLTDHATTPDGSLSFINSFERFDPEIDLNWGLGRPVDTVTNSMPICSTWAFCTRATQMLRTTKSRLTRILPRPLQKLTSAHICWSMASSELSLVPYPPVTLALLVRAPQMTSCSCRRPWVRQLLIISTLAGRPTSSTPRKRVLKHVLSSNMKAQTWLLRSCHPSLMDSLTISCTPSMVHASSKCLPPFCCLYSRNLLQTQQTPRISGLTFFQRGGRAWTKLTIQTCVRSASTVITVRVCISTICWSRIIGIPAFLNSTERLRWYQAPCTHSGSSTNRSRVTRRGSCADAVHSLRQLCFELLSTCGLRPSFSAKVTNQCIWSQKQCVRLHQQPLGTDSP